MTDSTPWQEAVRWAAGRTGVVLVIGEPDAGKSSFAFEAALQAQADGRRVWLLDADLGQGCLAPPGLVGVTAVDQPFGDASELRPRALAFVGATQPLGHSVPLIRAAHRLAQHAARRDADLILVDTCGLALPRAGERLKLALAESLQPGGVVLLQRDGELQRLGKLLRWLVGAPLLWVTTPLEVGRKSPAVRQAHRARMLAQRLRGARALELDAGGVTMHGGWPFSGRALSRGDLRQLGEWLRVETLHGEDTPDGRCLCVTALPKPADLAEARRRSSRRLLLTPAATLQGLLVGLIADDGHLVEIALLRGINFARSLLSLWTPARSLDRVRVLHYGRLRARTDGSEIAHLRPGDL